MTRNGRHHPQRPRIEVRQSVASPEEAAAISAAIEQFLRDTAPAPSTDAQPVSGWLRAARFEAVGLSADAESPWGRDV
jgi:hypothetical protein